MSEQRDQDVDELADRLFEAGRAEAVPAAARARALEASGLGGPTPAPDGSSAASKAWLKWGGAAVVALGIGATVVATRPPTAAVPAVPPPLASVATQSGQLPLQPAVEAPPAVEPPPPQTAAPEAPASSLPAARRGSTAPSGSASSADALAAELAALDRARAALRGGDPAAALTVLRDYDRAHPRGAMQSEALLLRVEALVHSGRNAEAERLAAPVIARNPDGLAARRLKGLLE